MITVRPKPGLFLIVGALALGSSAVADDDEPGLLPADPTPEEIEEVEERRFDEAALNEDPEAQRRALAEIPAADPDEAADVLSDAAPDEEPGRSTSLEFYGSARVHAINNFEVETGKRSSRVGDGNSRAGIRADWQYAPDWWLLGRSEIGVDLVNSFTTRGPLIGEGGLKFRLLYAGIDSDEFTAVAGKNWSAYYQVAGITDRFMIFGGSASGVYNAGTAGEATGTGRADDVIQVRTRIYPESWAPWLKPFLLNAQYQLEQPIPGLENVKYDRSFGASAFLEFQNEFGIGLAYNRAIVPENLAPDVARGLDGNAEAFAISTRRFGQRWYVSALYTVLDNMEITDTGRYFDATGIELYAQWQVYDKWWLIGGLNSLEPRGEDPMVGDYRIRYGVIGGRYTLRSFERMLYVEYRIDQSRTVGGSKAKDEITFGIRWDFSL